MSGYRRHFSDADNEFEEENEAEEEYLDDPGNSSTSIDHVSSGAVINSITSVSNTSNACSLVAKKNKVRCLAPFWVKTNRREDCGSGQACLQRVFCGGTCEAR